MTLTLEIVPEIEAALQAEAAERGQDVSDYVTWVLSLLASAPGSIGDNAKRRDIAFRLGTLNGIPAYDTRAGLPEIKDTSRSAEPDVYGYSEREGAQS